MTGNQRFQIEAVEELHRVVEVAGGRKPEIVQLDGVGALQQGDGAGLAFEAAAAFAHRLGVVAQVLGRADELHRRLQGRATDSAEVIAARMERARAEISHWDGYDYVIINDDVAECFEKIRAILEAERMKRARQTGLIPFVRGLMG